MPRGKTGLKFAINQFATRITTNTGNSSKKGLSGVTTLRQPGGVTVKPINEAVRKTAPATAGGFPQGAKKQSPTQKKGVMYGGSSYSGKGTGGKFA